MAKKKHKTAFSNNNQQDVMAKNRFDLRHITPLTPNQQKMFSAYRNGQNIVGHGFAGTGKTFISLYLALEEILGGSTLYDKVIIVRSAIVTGKQIGRASCRERV